MPRRRRSWRTRTRGTERQKGTRFPVDDKSIQAKRQALPSVGIAGASAIKKDVYTVACMDEDGNYIDFVTLATNEGQAMRKASNRGLKTMHSKRELKVVEGKRSLTEKLEKILEKVLPKKEEEDEEEWIQ